MPVKRQRKEDVLIDGERGENPFEIPQSRAKAGIVPMILLHAGHLV
jgi:hypothetical protein